MNNFIYRCVHVSFSPLIQYAPPRPATLVYLKMTRKVYILFSVIEIQGFEFYIKKIQILFLIMKVLYIPKYGKQKRIKKYNNNSEYI